MAKKPKEVEEVLFDLFIEAKRNIPNQSILKFLQEKWGHLGCKNLTPHFKMIKNEMENKGFGKIGQANHLPKYTKELIHDYLKKERLGNL